MHFLINPPRLFGQDRAAAVATGIVAIIRDALSAPYVRNQIAAALRDEFADAERQAISETHATEIRHDGE